MRKLSHRVFKWESKQGSEVQASGSRVGSWRRHWAITGFTVTGVWEAGKRAVFANVTQEVSSERRHSATTGTRRSHPSRPTRTSQGGGAEGSKTPGGRRSYFAPDNRQGPRVRQRVAWPQVEGQAGQIRAASFMGKKCPSILTKHIPERK